MAHGAKRPEGVYLLVGSDIQTKAYNLT